MHAMRIRLVAALSVFILPLLWGGGCKGDDSPTGSQGPVAITVNGLVKDVDGQPVSGATVLIKGKTATVTSGTGAFSVPDVTVPYDATLIRQQIAVVYQGLTRADPTLGYIASTTSSKSATISGTVPAATGKTTIVFFVSGNRALGRATATQTTGAYTMQCSWRDQANSHTGKLHVLRFASGPNGLPSQYDAYATRDLTISAGGTFSGNNFTAGELTDPTEQSITGSIMRPTSSYVLTTRNLLLNFGNAGIFLAGESGSTLADNFSYTVPAIPGATFEVQATAYVSVPPNERYALYLEKGIAAGSNDVSIALANPPQLNLPAHNGTNIDTTTQFLWAPGGGVGVHLALISPLGSGPLFYILTSGNSTSIPNLRSLGIELPSGASYQWLVYQFYPVSTINDAAVDSFWPFILGYGGDVGRGISEQFRFTTRP